MGRQLQENKNAVLTARMRRRITWTEGPSRELLHLVVGGGLFFFPDLLPFSAIIFLRPTSSQSKSLLPYVASGDRCHAKDGRGKERQNCLFTSIERERERGRLGKWRER